MKILIDHYIFVTQKHGGISRYFYELLKSFRKNEYVNVKTSIMLSNNAYLLSDSNMNIKSFFKNNSFKGRGLLMMTLNKINTIKNLIFDDFDLFHPTYYDLYFLKYLINKPFVITVHDLTHELYPDLLPDSKKVIENKKILINKATRIIAISNSTKNDIVKIYNVDENKIDVIYHGCTLKKKNANLENKKLPRNYILFVGKRNGYKNFVLFLNSVSHILTVDSLLFLVCVGGGKFNTKEIKLLKELNITEKVYQIDLNDTELSSAYQNAKIFVFPSLYEGFGFPLLEAFVNQCPVACSNTSSFPEVAQDAALYFDPTCEKSIQETITRLINDEKLQFDLISKSKKVIEHFSWQNTAKRTIETYKKALSCE
jgi:glycosyltransferase involved in cell wall biosynthesis